VANWTFRDSLTEIKRLVRRHEVLLREIAANTREARKTHAIDAPESILGVDEASESIFSQLIDPSESRNHRLDVSYEAVILNSHVYNNTFRSNLHGAADNQSDHARTITDAESDERTVVSTSEEAVVASDVEPDSKSLAIHARQIQPSILSLDITDIYAWGSVDHPTRSDGKLMLKKDQKMSNVQQLTRSIYCGEIESSSKSIRETVGYFDRDKVIVWYTLQRPLTVRTLGVNREPRRGHLDYEENDMIDIFVSLDIHLTRSSL
jgi:hypothetical protein